MNLMHLKTMIIGNAHDNEIRNVKTLIPYNYACTFFLLSKAKKEY